MPTVEGTVSPAEPTPDLTGLVVQRVTTRMVGRYRQRIVCGCWGEERGRSGGGYPAVHVVVRYGCGQGDGEHRSTGIIVHLPPDMTVRVSRREAEQHAKVMARRYAQEAREARRAAAVAAAPRRGRRRTS